MHQLKRPQNQRDIYSMQYTQTIFSTPVYLDMAEGWQSGVEP